MPQVTFTILLILGALAAVLVMRGSRLPSLEGRTESSAIHETADTRLGRGTAPRVAQHPGLSGLYPLTDSIDAYSARVLLARAADRTLDVQYYIWRNDMLGTLLFDALLAAADRGVRVRVLLDDNNTWDLDPVLAALDAHHNVEVRLFNPFVPRRPRIGYLTDFWRSNRRMHNKAFTADNQVTLIGGRNVGNEYFAAAEGPLFVDLDLMAIGPVVEEVSRDFDRYWASDSSYPLDRLVPAADTAATAAFREQAARVRESAPARAYAAPLRDSLFVQALMNGTLDLVWAPTRMVSDDPAKGLGKAAREALLPARLLGIVGHPVRSLDLITPYFVPTRSGAGTFAKLAREGVNVRILVNSLEATDVPIVHGGYIKHRRRLLEAGVKLYELKRFASGPRRPRRTGVLGSSATSLHAKTFAVDRGRLFIGSFNFDRRSVELNTEIGFVIESPELASRVQAVFDEGIPPNAYEVRLDGKGDLFWLEIGSDAIRHDTEPGTTWGQRALVRFFSWLPIDALL